jgi:hypothetical protein
MPVDADAVLEAVAILRAARITATTCGDDFEHWMVGDFIADDAALIRPAARQRIAEDHQKQPAAGPSTPPPWREVTTDGYHPRSLRPASQPPAVHQMLQDQLHGKHRLRLVLQEAVELAGRGKKRQIPDH